MQSARPKVFGHNLIAMSAVEIRPYQDFQKSVEAETLKHSRGGMTRCGVFKTAGNLIAMALTSDFLV